HLDSTLPIFRQCRRRVERAIRLAGAAARLPLAPFGREAGHSAVRPIDDVGGIAERPRARFRGIERAQLETAAVVPLARGERCEAAGAAREPLGKLLGCQVFPIAELSGPLHRGAGPVAPRLRALALGLAPGDPPRAPP